MQNSEAAVLVAGVTVLDLIPSFSNIQVDSTSLAHNLALLSPGQLMVCGPALAATGGAAPNTGLAFSRLGVPVRMIGRVGDDLFGKAIMDLLTSQAPELAKDMMIVPGETTSYSFVINPPGFDRAFLHCPGANDNFSADDISPDQLAGARLFHFGYPNVMRGMYQNQGHEMQRLYRKVKEAGLVTSLDLAFPDLSSESAQQDWQAIFARVLPDVDFFIPSFNESLVLVDRPAYDRIIEKAGQRKDSLGGILSGIDGGVISALGERLVGLGAAVVGLKLGDQGLYLRTTADRERLAWIARRLPIAPDAWLDREFLAPCFKVNVVGTVGSGDCTISGFLAGVLAGQSPAGAMTSAVGVGACSVEVADATGGIPTWDRVQARIRAGWARLPLTLSLPGWVWSEQGQIWLGPHDRTCQSTHSSIS